MAGGFFGGFAKSFGESFFRTRQQAREEEEADEQRQYSILTDALEERRKRGDTKGVAHVLETIDQFTQQSGKGGKGRKNQQSIMSFFANSLKNGIDTDEQLDIKGSMGDRIPVENKEFGTLNPPGPPESPTIFSIGTINKRSPFMSEEELQSRDTQLLIDRKEAMLPLELKEFGLKEDERARAFGYKEGVKQENKLELEGVRQQGRTDLATHKQTLRDEAYATRDINKMANSYLGEINPKTGLEYTPQEAIQAARGYTRNLDHVKLTKIKTDIDNIKIDNDLARIKTQAQMQHWKAIDNYLGVKGRQGDESLRIQAQKYGLDVERFKATLGQGSGISKQISIIDRQVDDILKQISTAQYNLTSLDSPFNQTDDDTKEQLKAQYLAEIEHHKNNLGQINGQRQQLYNQLDQLNKIVPNLNFGTQQSKPKAKSNDPLGIR
jgi:DNA-binding FrmR family transcriptional regulator